MSKINLTGNSKLLKKTKSRINQRELELALAEATECGSGINPLKGYVVLPNFNSSSGDIDGYYGLIVLNGAIAVDSLEDIKTLVNSFCNNPIVSATGVTLSGCPSSAITEETSPFQLTATVNPTGSLQTGTWTSSNTGVATVSSSGLVTVVAAGSAVITFTSTDGGFTATCNLLVTSVG